MNIEEGQVADTGVSSQSASIFAAAERVRLRSPTMRAVDIAAEIGVSEGELLAARVGHDAIRLGGDVVNLLSRMSVPGEVMALTRNGSAVHEKVGRYDNIDLTPPHGLVLNHDIDLRLFLSQWRSGFALRQSTDDGSIRRSLQFFDASGRAIHKIFARPATDTGAWDQIVDEWRAPDQSRGLLVEPERAATYDRPDSEIDVSGLRTAWSAMRDTHEFFGLLRAYQVGRLQALRLIGAPYVRPARLDAAHSLLVAASASGLDIMCFVGNPGCIQIHTGPVHAIRVIGPWLNVLDPGFSLHLRNDHVVSAWVVLKPTNDGIVTSIELFDVQARLIVQFFGARKPGVPELDDWRTLAGEQALKAAP